MKIKTKLRRFVKNILNDKILDGFSIIVDAKTDIWYLVGFYIHKNLFIVSKAETGSTLERIKQLFPGYDYDDLDVGMYDQVNMFPGFLQNVEVLLVNDKEIGYYACLGCVYETIN